MAIIDVKENWKERTAEEEIDRLGCSRVFSVLFDDQDDPIERPLLARSATGIPYIYQAHPYNSWLYVKNKYVKTVGPYLYEVTVNYVSSLDPSTTGVERLPLNPLLEPPSVMWFFATENVPISVDIYGKPIANSAGQTYDPPVTEPIDDLVLHIERNESEFKALLASEYKGAINSDVFMGFDPGFALCRMFKGTKIYAPSLVYFKVTYEFQFRWREVNTRDGNGDIQTIVYGWILRLLDQGYVEDTGETNPDGSKKLDTLQDQDGINIAEPVTFDGSGKRITKAVENNPPLPETCFLKFDVKKKKPFSVLGL